MTGRHTPSGVYERAAGRALSAFGVDDPPSELVDPDGVASFYRDCEERWLPAAPVGRREREATDLGNELIAAGERAPFEDVSALDDLGVPLGIVSNNRQGTVAFAVERFDRPVRTWL